MTNAAKSWTPEDEANRDHKMAECLQRESDNVKAFFATNPPPVTGDYRDEDEYDMQSNDSTGENGRGELFDDKLPQEGGDR